MHFQTGSVPTDHSRDACAPSYIESTQDLGSLHDQNIKQPCTNGPPVFSRSAPFTAIEHPLFPQAPRQPISNALRSKPNLRRRKRFPSVKSVNKVNQKAFAPKFNKPLAYGPHLSSS